MSWLRGTLSVLMAMFTLMLSAAQFHHHSDRGNVCVCGMLHLALSHTYHHDAESNPCPSDCSHHTDKDACGHLIFDKCDVPHPYDLSSHEDAIPDILPFGILAPPLLTLPKPDIPYIYDTGRDVFSIPDGHIVHAPGRSPPSNPEF